MGFLVDTHHLLGPAYRWFTSWFIHHSFEHVTSNMALFLVVAYQIEEKYGTWRIILLFFMSALGGEPTRATQAQEYPVRQAICKF